MKARHSSPRPFPAHWRASDVSEIVAEELSSIAAEIRGHQRVLPVLLRSICSELGIRVLRRGDVPEGKGYLKWDTPAGEPPTVLLPSNGNLKWYRFVTAHELGHYVLISRFGWHPSGRSDYWRTEAMCDYFARELLIPNAVVDARVARKAKSAMQWCNSLSNRANVPWIQTGKKITSCYSHVAFLRASKHGTAGTKVERTSLPNEKGRGIIIPSRIPFSKVVMEMMDAARQDSLAQRRALARDDFLGSTLGEFFSELAVKEIYAEVGPRAKQVKVAVLR